MPGPNGWFVLTGGPSTGKTSLQAELQKLGYTTLPEIARLVIDEAMADGMTVEELRRDEEMFQNTIVSRRIAIESTLDPKQTFILDRGTMDSLAYLRYYDFKLTGELAEACKKAAYAKVFLLEPLAVYEADYARTEDRYFAVRIQELLQAAYEEYGQPLVIVPPLTLAERTAFVVQEIKNTF